VEASQRRRRAVALQDAKLLVLYHCELIVLCFAAKRTPYVCFPTSESECQLVREHRDTQAIPSHLPMHVPRRSFPALAVLWLEMDFLYT
jgi:hypothetical protein